MTPISGALGLATGMKSIQCVMRTLPVDHHLVDTPKPDRPSSYYFCSAGTA